MRAVCVSVGWLSARGICDAAARARFLLLWKDVSLSLKRWVMERLGAKMTGIVGICLFLILAGIGDAANEGNLIAL